MPVVPDDTTLHDIDGNLIDPEDVPEDLTFVYVLYDGIPVGKSDWVDGQWVNDIDLELMLWIDLGDEDSVETDYLGNDWVMTFEFGPMPITYGDPNADGYMDVYGPIELSEDPIGWYWEAPDGSNPTWHFYWNDPPPPPPVGTEWTEDGIDYVQGPGGVVFETDSVPDGEGWYFLYTVNSGPNDPPVGEWKPGDPPLWNFELETGTFWTAGDGTIYVVNEDGNWVVFDP